MRGAPVASNPLLSQSIRRFALPTTETPPPILVESSGTAAVWAGNFVVWITSAASGLDVPETSVMTATTNGLLVDNPPMERFCTPTGGGIGLPWCNAHPSAWEFGTDSNLTKPIGKQTITFTFGDGTVGTFTDYVYDGWQIACGQGLAYVSGVPTIVTRNPDVMADCTNGQLVFPHGVVQAAAPMPDAFGRYETVFTTVTAPVAVPSGSPTRIPSTYSYGTVYVFATGDGGFAKIYPTLIGQHAPQSSFGMSLHAQTDGSFAY
jgi:hypothetical protein